MIYNSFPVWTLMRIHVRCPLNHHGLLEINQWSYEGGSAAYVSRNWWSPSLHRHELSLHPGIKDNLGRIMSTLRKPICLAEATEKLSQLHYARCRIEISIEYTCSRVLRICFIQKIDSAYEKLVDSSSFWLVMKQLQNLGIATAAFLTMTVGIESRAQWSGIQNCGNINKTSLVSKPKGWVEGPSMSETSNPFHWLGLMACDDLTLEIFEVLIEDLCNGGHRPKANRALELWPFKGHL